MIAETAFPQGKILGERPRNRGRSPSYLLLVVLLDRMRGGVHWCENPPVFAGAYGVFTVNNPRTFAQADRR